MKLGQHCSAILKKLECNKEIQILHGTALCYPDSSFLIWTQSYSFILPKGDCHNVSVMLPCSRTGVVRGEIILKCSIAGQRLIPTVNCGFACNIVLSVCICSHQSGSKKEVFQFTVDQTPFPAGITIHQHMVTPLWYKTVERKEKVIVLKICKATLIIRIFFQVRQYCNNTNCCVQVFSKRSILLDSEDSKVP